MGRCCAVSVCKHNSIKTKVNNKQIIYHRFPMGNDLLSKSIRDEWIRRCTRDYSINPATSQICSDHFCETDYERDLKNELLNLPQKRKLKAAAVPTLNLGYVEINESDPSHQSIAIKERKILIQKILDSSASSTPKRLPSQADEIAKQRETHNVCAVNSCKYVKVSSPKLSFFRFPKAPDMREQWIERCNRPSPFNIEAARVCSRHFKEDDFVEDFQARILKQTPKRMLKKTAIPSILLDAAVDITEPSTLAPVEEIYIQCPDITIDNSESGYIDSDDPSVQIENIQPVPDDNIQHSKLVSTEFMPKQRDANKIESSDIRIEPVKPLTSIGTLLSKEANSTAVIHGPQESVTNQDLQQATISSTSVVTRPPTLNAYLVNNNNKLQILIGKPRPDIQKNANIGNLASRLPEENLSLTSESIRVICRVCLLKYGNVNLYETKYKDLYYSEVLEAVTGLKIKKENPKSICNGCAQDLIKSYSFKMQSEKSELALMKFKEEMEIEITNKELIDHDYAITRVKSVQENLPNVPVQPSQLIFAQNPTPMFYLYNGAITSLQPIQQNPPNVVNDASTQPSPFVFTQNRTPTFCLQNDTITSLESVQENPANVFSDPPNLTPLVFPEIGPLNLDNDNLNNNYNNDVEIDTTIDETLAKKKPKVKKKYIPNQMTKKAMYEKSRNIRQAYSLIATGKVEEGKKLLADNKIKIPPRLLLALKPSDCKVCGEHLNSEYEYKKHAKLTKHYRTPFPCDHCDRIFPSKCMLQTHKTCVLRASRLCDICGASFSSNKGLMQHVNKTHGEKKYKCKICGIPHADLGQLFRHRWRAHRDLRKPRKRGNTAVCEFCGAILGSKTALSKHQTRMHQNLLPPSSRSSSRSSFRTSSKNRHECGICEASFPYVAQLMKHQSVHSSEKYECGFCNGMFKDQKKFINHRMDRHAVLPIDADVSIEYVPSQCTFCETVCPNKQALSVHLKEHGIDVCAYCDDIFDNANHLVDHHIKLHGSVPEWMCRYCNKTYEDRNSLLSHLTLHKCKTYKCDKCPKLFDSSNRLKRHKLIHGEELNYECRFCLKRFRYQCTTVVHERIHTGERPYKCDICGSSHICASNLNKHRQTHHTMNKYRFDNESLTLELE